jgi:5-methylcytosine-specific restriction endonuclease McrA
MPIRVASVKRCLKLIFGDKASIVDPADYSVYSWLEWADLDATGDEYVLTTTRANVKVPEVIVLSKHDKVYIKDLRLTKRNIYIRDRYKCQYTGKQLKFDEANIDHVIPRSRGGKNTWSNLVVCTKEINSMKGDRTPAEAGLKLIKKPVKPSPDGPHKLMDPKFNMPESWSKFIKVKK